MATCSYHINVKFSYNMCRPLPNWFIVIILPIPFYFGHTLLSHERYIQLQLLPPALFENNKNS